MQENADWYDAFYAKSKVHRMQAEDFDFYQVWLRALAWVHDHGYSRIRELGCGPGHFARVLQNGGWVGEYVGEDFSSVAINLARTRTPTWDFRVCDITTEAPIVADAVVAFETLEHVEADMSVLARCGLGMPVCFSVPSVDLPGHVRFFRTATSVRERYERFVRIDTLREFQMDDETFWLVLGKIKMIPNEEMR